MVKDDPSFPPSFPEGGPLAHYRAQASFNWKTMALLLDKEEILRFKYEIWNFLATDPIFAYSPTKRSLHDERRVIMQQTFRIMEKDFLNETKGEIGDPVKVMAMTTALGQYSWSLCTKRSIFMDFFTNAVRGLAKSGYHFDILEKAYKMELTGCVAMTEIGHGTNTKAFRTKATYDTVKGVFILETPDFEAAKCWSGGLGKSTTHAFVMAQLYTPDGQCHGLHGFVVPIRDPLTFLTYPGVTIFDMGEKVGLNGLDNGVMLFDNYAIKRESLLNKTGSVSGDGIYISPFKDPNKRFGAALGNTSAARAAIITMCAANLASAVTISIRYSAVRRQFSATNASEELPVIEYQMQQWRLFPYLAAAYVIKFVGDSIYQDFVNFIMSSFNTDIDPELISNWGIEIHVLSSSGKPIGGWLARDAIQESREACGGHGYLRSAGIGVLRDDHDANVTYEGDNNVLLQQTSNWLLTIYSNPHRSELIDKMPMGTLSFLRIESVFHNLKFTGEMTPQSLLSSYKWLVYYLLQTTAEKVATQQTNGSDSFTSKNQSQVYFARTLAIAFIEHYCLDVFWNKLVQHQDAEIRTVLTKLMLLYGYWSLEKHLGTLYQGGHCNGDDGNVIREGILKLCEQLKPEAIALVDAIAPPDFVLNSALGNSDGEVYKHLRSAMMMTPRGFERDDYWKDIVEVMTMKGKL